MNHHSAVSLLVVVAFACSSGLVRAQPASTSAKQRPNNYGSPLDTLKSTHLWTDVPPARDFVRETRPDPKALHYTPVTGVDPARPKARDKANIEALQAELEHDRLRNEAKARPLRGTFNAAHRKRKVAR